MKYLWTEDTGAGLHFWKLVNQLFFDNALVVESKESNQGILYSLTSSWILGNVTRIPRHELPQTLDFSDFLPLFT